MAVDVVVVVVPLVRLDVPVVCVYGGVDTACVFWTGVEAPEPFGPPPVVLEPEAVDRYLN